MIENGGNKEQLLAFWGLLVQVKNFKLKEN